MYSFLTHPHNHVSIQPWFKILFINSSSFFEFVSNRVHALQLAWSMVSGFRWSHNNKFWTLWMDWHINKFHSFCHISTNCHPLLPIGGQGQPYISLFALNFIRYIWFSLPSIKSAQYTLINLDYCNYQCLPLTLGALKSKEPTVLAPKAYIKLYLYKSRTVRFLRFFQRVKFLFLYGPEYGLHIHIFYGESPCCKLFAYLMDLRYLDFLKSTYNNNIGCLVSNFVSILFHFLCILKQKAI